MKDVILRAVNKQGTIRAFVANTTKLTEKARQIHDTYPVVSAALGRMMCGCLMMGVTLKSEQENISLQVKGDGPIGGIVAVADCSGEVRGYANNNKVDIPLKKDGKLDVGSAVGEGYLTVIKDMGMKKPYVGRVELQSGEIAEDLAYYYATSEQVPSAIALGVLIEKDCSVRSAGGYMVQLMPDVGEEEIVHLENNLKGLDSISTMFDKGMSAEDVVGAVLKDFEYTVTDSIEPKYKCNCNTKRIEKVLISLGREELQDILHTQGEAEIVCYFCNEKYHFERNKIEDILSKC